MNISSIVSSTLLMSNLSQTSQATQTSSSTSVTGLLAPATKRLTQQLESTKVQLSAYGQIKGAFSTAQSSATGLASAAKSKTATNADLEKAAQAFVDAYNQATSTVGGAVSKTGTQTGALTSDIRAQFAGNDLARSLTSGTTVADLKQAGITQNKNGSLTLDVKALGQALQSAPTEVKATLATLGQQVGTSVGRELASTGNVGASVSSLTSREQSLTNQQASLQQQGSALETALSAQSNLFNAYATTSYISAYKSLFG